MNVDHLSLLSSFDPAVRKQALDKLLGGDWRGRAAATDAVNMHMHSFCSYNGEGWSPSRLAWEARNTGLHAVGLVDFDVLAGLDEWFAATDRLELRAAAGFESRVFFAPLAEQEINSPGEPGGHVFHGLRVRPAAGGGHA